MASIASAADGLRPAPEALAAGLVGLGYAAFRPGQQEAIDLLFTARRLLLVAPTGGGKSLTYQLPATLLPGTSLVISPLVALMHDQVAALQARGVPATFLAATLSAEEMRQRLLWLRSGACKIAYVAPERLAYPGFRSLVHDLGAPLVAVDEAHCISEWGHDFRPDYLGIGALLAELRPAYVLACTATATPVVRDEIVARLGLPADTPQVVRGFARPNLALRVSEAASERDRGQQVDALLAEALGGPRQSRGTAIVYAPTRRMAEEEAARLLALGWRAAAYHAGLAGSARTAAQQAFTRGDLEVVAATNAFGMGIDRADVRAVVHLAPPGSIESYYQEVGRAGRDGEPASGLLLHAPGDLPLRRRLIFGAVPPDSPTAAASAEHKWNLFLELMRWIEGGSCRHDAILRYFGDEAETLAGCGRCDVCLGLPEAEDASEDAVLVVRKALSAVARVHRRFGLTAAAKLLAGAHDPRLSKSGLDQSPTFGVLKGHSEDWLVRLLRRCVTAGFVELSPGDRPVVELTSSGRAVMKGERPPRMALPSDRGPGLASRPPSGRGSAAARASDPALSADELFLFERLRLVRLELAREDGVPPFVVASDRALRDVARLRPRSTSELVRAYGIGPAKAERYGARFLAVIAAA